MFNLNARTSIDLLQSELRNVKLAKLVNDPDVPTLSQVWFNLTEQKLKYFDGNIIKTLATIHVSNLSEFPATGQTDTLYIALDTGKAYYYDEVYVSIMGDGTTSITVTSSIPIGNIPAGTIFVDKTPQEMWDALLNPPLFPTFVAPSVAFQSTVTGLYEIGQVFAQIDFLAEFDQGAITPQYASDSDKRSGLPITYAFTGAGLPALVATQDLTYSHSIYGIQVINGQLQWCCTVNYAEGVQPKDSRGGDYATPLNAGSTAQCTLAITGVYPAYANITTIDTIEKLPLQLMTAPLITDVAAQIGGVKQTIDIPIAWNNGNPITKVEQFNTLSNVWEEISLALFTITNTTKTIQGNLISYKRYQPTTNVNIGRRLLRWT